jgi:hypothetical protein
LSIPFQIAVHDGEEDLKEEVDGIDKHCYQVEPRFSRHDYERGYENASVVVGSGVVGDVSREYKLVLVRVDRVEENSRVESDRCRVVGCKRMVGVGEGRGCKLVGMMPAKARDAQRSQKLLLLSTAPAIIKCGVPSNFSLTRHRPANFGRMLY